ncbi:MAG: DNA primase family protein [Planctomycetota bacterium]|jgi:P4 family phage/plasmid primase-like protien
MTGDTPNIEPYDLARMFLTDKYAYDRAGEAVKMLRWWNQGFYRYRDGCYHFLSDGELKAELAEYLHENNIRLSTQKVNLVTLCLQSLTEVERGVELNSWMDGVNGAKVVSVANGNISFSDSDDEGRHLLLLHSPQYFTLTKLPYDYDPDAKCSDWLMFLDDVMVGRQDYILLLQQWCGYLFRPDLREQKFLLCTGEGANGKGVFFEVVQALVGEDNCSQVGLSRFGSPFALHSTLGKVVNVTNESSHIIEHEAENVLKSIVAGDRFTFERKFKESISAVPTSKIMIATNSLPRFNDRTEGVWRRMLYVPFDKTIAEESQIKHLADLLKEELPGILNWGLKGLRLLNGAGSFKVPEANKELIEQYRRDSDPARAFLLENYTTSPNGEDIACGDLYQEYNAFCEENGCRPMNNRTFGQQVRRIFPDTERARIGSKQEDRQWIYKGLVSRTSQASQEIPI